MSVGSDTDKPGPGDLRRAFDVLDGGPPGGVSPKSMADARAAKAIWRSAKISPDTLDFERLDRAVLRAAAEERLRRDEASRIGRVLWPGLAFAGALAAAGALAVVVFGRDEVVTPGTTPISAAAGIVSELSPGQDFGAAGQAVTFRVSRATVAAEAGARGRVLEVSPEHTRVALDAGSAHFEVGRRAPGGEFVVVAGSVNVTVVGTAFRVERAGDVVTVSVSHGSVVVSQDGQERATLSDGERIVLEPLPEALVQAQAEAELGNAFEAIPAVPHAVPVGEPAAAEALVPSDAPRLQDFAPVEAVAVARPVEVARTAAPARTGRPAAKVSAAPRPAPVAPTVAPPPVETAVAPVAPAAVIAVVDAPPPSPRSAVALDITEDDRAATAALRELAGGLTPGACESRLQDIRAWIADHPGHGRVRTAQHALAYCYHALGRLADADRLFQRLGFKLKDVMDPRPPQL